MASAIIKIILKPENIDRCIIFGDKSPHGNKDIDVCVVLNGFNPAFIIQYSLASTDVVKSRLIDDGYTFEDDRPLDVCLAIANPTGIGYLFNKGDSATTSNIVFETAHNREHLPEDFLPTEIHPLTAYYSVIRYILECSNKFAGISKAAELQNTGQQFSDNKTRYELAVKILAASIDMIDLEHRTEYKRLTMKVGQPGAQKRSGSQNRFGS